MTIWNFDFIVKLLLHSCDRKINKIESEKCSDASKMSLEIVGTWKQNVNEDFLKWINMNCFGC